MAGFVVEKVGDRLVARGELDTDTARYLDAVVEDLDGEPIVLDLAAVSFIDSSGIRALLRARQRHNALRIENPSPQAGKVLEMTGLTNVLFGND